MDHSLNAGDVRAQVSIADLLAKLGYHPVKPSAEESLYFSMLGPIETKPSFTVNDKLGVWYDQSLGKGGDVIDFGLVYWKLPLAETLVKIMQTHAMSVRAQPSFKRRHAVKLPHYRVEDTLPLGHQDDITAYLKTCGLWEVAQERLREIYYYVQDEKGLYKHFHAPGVQNESGGWEVRNAYFRACIGRKGLTIVPGDEHCLSVFEDYFDYLSLLTEGSGDGTVIIFNGPTFLQAAIAKARSFPSVDLYLPRNHNGMESTLFFQRSIPKAFDQSIRYKGYTHYLEKIKPVTKHTDLFKDAFRG